jgi:hypothetical protein
VDKLLHIAGAVQHGIVGVEVQMYELRHLGCLDFISIVAGHPAGQGSRISTPC